MIVYSLFFILSSSFIIFNNSVFLNKKPIKFLFYILLLIFIGLRYQIGGDWDTYLEIYNYSDLNFLISSHLKSDIGYNLIQIISKFFNLGIYGVNLFCAIIFLISIHLICSLNREYWLWFMILLPYLIFIVATGYTRQSIAIGFSTIGIYFLISNHQTYYQNLLTNHII